jgi:glycosyltransferase involved in cell wall biosynthesis
MARPPRSDPTHDRGDDGGAGPRTWIDLSSAAHDRAGMGRYQSSLARALLALGAPVGVFLHDRAGSRLRPPLSDVDTLSAGMPLRRWRLRAAASYFGAPSLDRALPGVRRFHATDHLLPKLSSARSIFTLHDTAYLRYPEYYLPRNRIYLRIMMPRFLRRADRVIVVSEHTRVDALRHYGLEPGKVHVIPEGVDPWFTPEQPRARIDAVRGRFGLPGRYVLSVGTIQPRKNLATLLDAYAVLRRREPDLGLVIAGALGWLYESFFDRRRALGLEDAVVVTGAVPDEDLPAMYAGAEVFAYPSVYEGFGLPPLEAMACGTPVASSNATSLPEVVGDAGALVEPLDVDAWVTEIDRLLHDEARRRELRGRGLARARTFTWERAARRTLEVYGSLPEPGDGSGGPAAVT